MLRHRKSMISVKSTTFCRGARLLSRLLKTSLNITHYTPCASFYRVSLNKLVSKYYRITHFLEGECPLIFTYQYKYKNLTIKALELFC